MYTGVDSINCFAPYDHLFCLTPNFLASKKLLKSWAEGAKVGLRGAKPFMKSTPGERAMQQLKTIMVQKRWFVEHFNVRK